MVVIVFLPTLIVNPIVANNLTASICQGDSMLLGGAYQTTAGDYVDSLSSAYGCDSIVSTTLTVHPVVTNSVTAIICQGDSMMLGGAYQRTAGSYVDSLSSAYGCDSIVSTTLTVNPVVTNGLTASICQGDSMMLAGAYQTASGNYVDTLSSANGCDSILTTTLIVNPIVTNNLTASICQGDSLLVGGEFQTIPGSYVDTLSSANGCDSILTTMLIVNSVVTNNLTASICQGDSLLVRWVLSNSSWKLCRYAFINPRL